MAKSSSTERKPGVLTPVGLAPEGAMTKFNPNNKKLLSFSECFAPAMEVTDSKDAKQYLEKYIEYLECRYSTNADLKKISREEIEEHAKSNIAYYAGYYSHETRLRVEKLFDCVHPLLGPASDGIVSAEQAFNAGVEYSRKKLKDH